MRRGRSTGKNPVLVIIFLENTREFPEIITSTGAKFWLRFCLSALVLVIFKSPILRRFSNSKCFLEGFLEGACKGFW